MITTHHNVARRFHQKVCLTFAGAFSSSESLESSLLLDAALIVLAATALPGTDLTGTALTAERKTKHEETETDMRASPSSRSTCGCFAGFCFSFLVAARLFTAGAFCGAFYFLSSRTVWSFWLSRRQFPFFGLRWPSREYGQFSLLSAKSQPNSCIIPSSSLLHFNKVGQITWKEKSKEKNLKQTALLFWAFWVWVCEQNLLWRRQNLAGFEVGKIGSF